MSNEKTRTVIIKDRQGFTQVSNQMLSDRNISYKAKGLLCHLLSHDQDKFTITSDTLLKHGADGPKAIQSGIKELKKNGYLKILREAGNKGKWSYVINQFGNKFTDTPKTGESPKTDQSVLGGCYNKNNNIKNNNLKDSVENQRPGEIQVPEIKSESAISHTDIALGFKTSRQVKDTIYRKLSDRGIPFTPGSDEAAIEKHKTDSPDEFIYKINRLEKLHYIKCNWVRFKDKLPKAHLQACEKLAIQSPTIPWALGNFSTEVDGVFDLVKNLVAEEVRLAEIHAQNQRRADLERAAYLALQDEAKTLEKPHKSAIEKLEEFRAAQQPEESGEVIQIPELDASDVARMNELIMKPIKTEDELAELKLIMQKRTKI